MKKFFSLVLALVMALSLTTVAWGAAMPADDADGTADNVINLTADFTLDTIFKVTTGNVTIKAANPVKITTALVDAIQVETGATLTLGENVTIESGKGAILYANGGTININGATLVSTTGATEALGFAANGGTINMNSGTVKAYWTGLTASGAGSKVNILGGTVESTNSNATLAKNYGTTTITGGTIKTGGNFVALWAKDNGVLVVNGGAAIAPANGAAISLESSATATVSAGTFDGPVSVKPGTTLTVSGGTFSTDVSAYVATGSSAVLSGGKFVVSTGSTGGNTTTYTAKDVTIVTKAGTKVTIADGDKVVMTAENKKTVNGKFASVIPTYFTYNGVNYVVCHEASATHLVTVKGVQYYTCAFTGAVPSVEKDGGALYTAPKTATCGKVGANEDKYVVIDNVYYLVSNLGTRYVLVGDKMVVYSTTTGTMQAHVYDATKSELKYNSDGTVASFKCAVCNNFVSVVAKKPAFATNYTAITLGNEGTYYYVTNTAGISAGSSTPSTDKVQSAETFDAGIAMYVGMSVMAAAGSVVVLKKRED